MIVLDTHIWVWRVHGDEQLTQAQREAIAANEARRPTWLGCYPTHLMQRSSFVPWCLSAFVVTF